MQAWNTSQGYIQHDIVTSDMGDTTSDKLQIRTRCHCAGRSAPGALDMPSILCFSTPLSLCSFSTPSPNQPRLLMTSSGASLDLRWISAGSPLRLGPPLPPSFLGHRHTSGPPLRSGASPVIRHILQHPLQLHDALGIDLSATLARDGDPVRMARELLRSPRAQGS